jgi:hypothetical protein
VEPSRPPVAASTMSSGCIPCKRPTNSSRLPRPCLVRATDPLLSAGPRGAIQTRFGDIDPNGVGDIDPNGGRRVHDHLLGWRRPDRPSLCHAGSAMAPATLRAPRRWRCGDPSSFPASQGQRGIGLPHLVRTVSLLESKIQGVAHPSDEGLGRSRGGLATKFHLACDGRGRPLSCWSSAASR